MKTFSISIENAVTLYNSKPELNTQDIKDIFGVKSYSAVSRIKKSALELMKKEGVSTWSKGAVDTEIAFRAWNFDIANKLKNYLCQNN